MFRLAGMGARASVGVIARVPPGLFNAACIMEFFFFFFFTCIGRVLAWVLPDRDDIHWQLWPRAVVKVVNKRRGAYRCMYGERPLANWFCVCNLIVVHVCGPPRSGSPEPAYA